MEEGYKRTSRVSVRILLAFEFIWFTQIVQNYRSWVTHYVDQVPGIEISQYAENSTWGNVLLRHSPVSKYHTSLNALSYCMYGNQLILCCYNWILFSLHWHIYGTVGRSLHYTVVIQRPHPKKKVKDLPSPLYFHRNTSNRFNLQHFWGFFSTSADPCMPNTGLEELDWTFEYRM